MASAVPSHLSAGSQRPALGVVLRPVATLAVDTVVHQAAGVRAAQARKKPARNTIKEHESLQVPADTSPAVPHRVKLAAPTLLQDGEVCCPAGSAGLQPFLAKLSPLERDGWERPAGE